MKIPTAIKKISLSILTGVLALGVAVPGVFAATLADRLSGRILLQVQQVGQAWYINPLDKKRYYMGRAQDAYSLMRELGLGITNRDLALIPEYGKPTTSVSWGLVNRLKGRIVLQVEARGEAWYINPENSRRYFLGRPQDAYNLMRELGLGITDQGLSRIDVARGDTGSSTSSETPVASVDEPTVELSGPLEIDDTVTAGTPLTQAGIFSETNKHRALHGLPAFRESSALSLAALKKVEDMIAQEYFEHVSPQGKDISDLATESGYDYITVGENIALGNVFTDATLLEGWMNSPGHRANILNTTFTELGVAAAQGMYEGRAVWFAAQEFGKPVSDCPVVDSDLHDRIVLEQSALHDQADVVALARERLDSYAPLDTNDQATVDAYNTDVASYNTLAADYNTQRDRLEVLVYTYNLQVEAFSECASD